MNIYKIILFLLTAVILQGCLDDNIPRNRPILEINTDNIDSGDTDVDPDETEEKADSRPSGAIIIQSGHCACAGNKAVSIGNCESFCSTKSNTETTKKLYFSVELTEAITLDVFEDVKGFCTTQEDLDKEGKACVIEAKNESGAITEIDFSPAEAQQSFTINIEGVLSEDETYRISIKEKSTGATSTSVQLRIASDIIEDDVGGPLALMPVNQYTCLFREGGIDTSTGGLYNDSISRFHFYFISKTRPEPLKKVSLPTVACYDFQTYGTTPINSPLLEENTDSFTVWNKMDPRFYDLDNNGVLKIHELIEQKMILMGQPPTSTPTLFYDLNWLNGIDDGDDAAGGDSTTTTLTTTSANLGMYMTPFLDTTNNYTAYCPTQLQYYSSNPLFKALRELVGVDTEALYAAKQNNVCDFLLIKESLVKKIWFYIENGQHIQPTTATIRDKNIQFYWPADTNSPYIKKSHQRVYTIKGSDEISCGGATVDSGSQDSSGNSTVYPPHDKRIGCIPKLED